MKKLFLIALAALALGTSPVAADPGTEKTFGVNFDVFGIFLDVFSGSVEMKLPIPKMTAKADITWSPNYFFISGVSGLDLVATGRFYYGALLPFDLSGPTAFLKSGPLEGLYVGGGASIHSWSWTYSGYSWSYFAPGIVIETGAKYFPEKDWSWWPKNFYTEGGLVVNLNLPAKWKDSNGNEFTGTEPSGPGFAGFSIDFGYAF